MRLCLALALLLLFSTQANAQGAPELEVDAKQVFLVDTATGTVLYEKDAQTPMPTSSMSKMMTIYMVFDALRAGTLSLEDTFPVSKHAWEQEGSRMFLTEGQQAKVEDLIRGVIVQSGNDASVVLAEGLGNGSEENFVETINRKAQALGMTESHFANASGLPDEKHYSTARDLAILALTLYRDFPEYYHYFSEKEFTYNKIKQTNRNPLLFRDMDVDGLKTGHTEVGGYGLAASSLRDGRRLILVINGMMSKQKRAEESAKVLNYGYREFGLYRLIKEGDIMASPAVWLGKKDKVEMVATKDITLTLPRKARDELKAIVSFSQPIPAPIEKGSKIGKLTITAPGMDDEVIDLVAADSVEELDFFDRILGKLLLLLKKG